VFWLFPASMKSNLKTLSVKYFSKLPCADTMSDNPHKMNEMIVLIANLFLQEYRKAKNIH
jgi:hypothetical protein